MIHIGRAGVRLGSFSVFEIRQGLATGQFLLTDLGWKEGMEHWKPLSEFSEFEPVEPFEPFEPEPPELDPFPAPAVAEQATAEGLPWDHRRELGIISAMARTVKLVLVNPQEAFTRMRPEGSLFGPLLYNLIGGWLGFVILEIYALLIARAQPVPPANLTPWEALFYLTPEKAMVQLQLMVVMGPIIVTVALLFSSICAHLFLMLAGGANKSFQVTLRTLCFANGSAMLLFVVPMCGGPLAIVWWLVCAVIGLAAAHGTTTWRTVTAVGLFAVACGICCIGSFLLAMGAAGSGIPPVDH